jgi:hypothetical protein
MQDGLSTHADGRIQIVENALRAACQLARAQGVTLVTGAFEVSGGVCAWGALNRYPSVDPAVGLEPEEYDAIEMGWDGESGWLREHEEQLPWWALGRRLALRFGPVPASSLGAA